MSTRHPVAPPTFKLRTAASVLSGALALAGGALWQRWRRPLPPLSGERTLHALAAPAELLTDEHGFPHLYAANEHDLWVAQGFATARERLFQLCFLRQVAAGRLSEWAGAATVELDRWARLYGLRRTAERAWAHAGDASRAALLAYCEGVNAAIQGARQRAWPLEFALLRVEPEPWLPVDSLSILRLLALSQSVGWENDLLREGVRSLLGEEEALAMLPLPPATVPPINQPGLAALRGVAMGLGGGSNCWAVDGTRSATGLPLLANDPHLALTLPAIWVPQHLHCPTLQVAGLALAGVPGIVIGHNEHGAWGVTSGFADVQDLYIEARVPSDDGVPTFRWGEQVLPATLLEERIFVRGQQAPVAQRIVITRHGPLISELLPDEPRDLALRWPLEEPDDTLGALLACNRATSWESFRDALRDLGQPPLHFTWAGRDGTVAWIQAGRIPTRGGGARGTVPLDGASGAQEWLGYLALDELPQLARPATGWLVHANQRPVDEQYPHDLGVDFYPGFRAARIAALLTGRATHDADSFRAIQLDGYSYPEHQLARAVGALPALRGELALAQRMLDAWDGQMRTESVAATLAHELAHQLRQRMVATRLAQWSAQWQGKVRHPELKELSPLAFGGWAWMLERLDAVEHPCWAQESRDECLLVALDEAMATLRARLGPEPSRWSWGRAHRATLAHPLGVLPLLGRWLSRGPYPLAGGAFSPNPDLSTIQRLQPLPPVGASARVIADVSDWDRYEVALAGGASGHPASRYYANGLRVWRRGRTQRLAWTRPAVERATRHRLRLLPP